VKSEATIAALLAGPWLAGCATAPPRVDPPLVGVSALLGGRTFDDSSFGALDRPLVGALELDLPLPAPLLPFEVGAGFGFGGDTRSAIASLGGQVQEVETNLDLREWTLALRWAPQLAAAPGVAFVPSLGAGVAWTEVDVDGEGLTGLAPGSDGCTSALIALGLSWQWSRFRLGLEYRWLLGGEVELGGSEHDLDSEQVALRTTVWLP
jgi:hypothetical protein